MPIDQKGSRLATTVSCSLNLLTHLQAGKPYLEVFSSLETP